MKTPLPSISMKFAITRKISIRRSKMRRNSSLKTLTIHAFIAKGKRYKWKFPKTILILTSWSLNFFPQLCSFKGNGDNIDFTRTFLEILPIIKQCRVLSKNLIVSSSTSATAPNLQKKAIVSTPPNSNLPKSEHFPNRRPFPRKSQNKECQDKNKNKSKSNKILPRT